MDDGLVCDGEAGTPPQLAADAVRPVHGSGEGEPPSASVRFSLSSAGLTPRRGSRKPLPEETEGGGQCDGLKPSAGRSSHDGVCHRDTCRPAEQVKPAGSPPVWTPPTKGS